MKGEERKWVGKPRGKERKKYDRKSEKPEVVNTGSGTCAMGIGGKINRPKTVRRRETGGGKEGGGDSVKDPVTVPSCRSCAGSCSRGGGNSARRGGGGNGDLFGNQRRGRCGVFYALQSVIP